MQQLYLCHILSTTSCPLHHIDYVYTQIKLLILFISSGFSLFLLPFLIYLQCEHVNILTFTYCAGSNLAYFYIQQKKKNTLKKKFDDLTSHHPVYTKMEIFQLSKNVFE